LVVRQHGGDGVAAAPALLEEKCQEKLSNQVGWITARRARARGGTLYHQNY
jgi:hypothetical protein